MIFFEILGGLVFVISSGLLFNKRYRENLPLVLVTGLIAIVSSFFLTKEVIDDFKRPPVPALEEIGPSAIWKPPTQLDIYDHMSHCNELACFLSMMRNNGASPEAIEFSRKLYNTQQRYAFMDAFQEMGIVDVATIADPLVMNEGLALVLVNGKPGVIDIDSVGWHDLREMRDRELGNDREFRQLLARFPDAMIWRAIDVSSPNARIDGGQSMLVTWDIRNGGRSGVNLGSATFIFNFRKDGSFDGARLTSVNRSVEAMRQ